MQSLHAHEVLQMIQVQGLPATREDLVNKIVQEFGNEATYFSCSDQDMSAESLVSFFEAMGKVNFGSTPVTQNKSCGCG